MLGKIVSNYRDTSIEEGDYIRKYIKSKAKALNRDHFLKLFSAIVAFLIGWAVLRNVRDMMISFSLVKLLICNLVGILMLTYSMMQILLFFKERVYVLFNGLERSAYIKQFKVLEVQVKGAKNTHGNVRNVRIIDDVGAEYEVEALLFEKIDKGLLILLEVSDNYMIIPKKDFKGEQ